MKIERLALEGSHSGRNTEFKEVGVYNALVTIVLMTRPVNIKTLASQRMPAGIRAAENLGEEAATGLTCAK